MSFLYRCHWYWCLLLPHCDFSHSWSLYYSFSLIDVSHSHWHCLVPFLTFEVLDISQSFGRLFEVFLFYVTFSSCCKGHCQRNYHLRLESFQIHLRTSFHDYASSHHFFWWIARLKNYLTQYFWSSYWSTILGGTWVPYPLLDLSKIHLTFGAGFLFAQILL